MRREEGEEEYMRQGEGDEEERRMRGECGRETIEELWAERQSGPYPLGGAEVDCLIAFAVPPAPLTPMVSSPATVPGGG
jgi:hypothetical protein